MRTLTLTALLLLAVPATALAKGPSEATIEGPGLATPLRIDGAGSWTKGSLWATFVEETAFFPTVWGGDHTYTIRATRPAGALGPRYRVTFRLPGPAGRTDLIRQDFYPHARGGPVTYTPPGQRYFERERTIGGWYRGKARLRTMLIAAGLPNTEPVRPRGADEPANGKRWTAATAIILLVVVAAAGTFIRRTRRAPFTVPR